MDIILISKNKVLLMYHAVTSFFVNPKWPTSAILKICDKSVLGQFLRICTSVTHDHIVLPGH